MTKGDFSLSMTGGFVLVVVATAVGALLVTDLLGSEQQTDTRIQQIVRNANNQICQNYRDGQEIDMEDFKTILYARHIGKCEKQSNVVTLGFRLSNTSLEQTAKDLGITYSDENRGAYVLYSDSCLIRSIDGVLVGKEEDFILFNRNDEIQIKTAGSAVQVCPS